MRFLCVALLSLGLWILCTQAGWERFSHMVFYKVGLRGVSFYLMKIGCSGPSPLFLLLGPSSLPMPLHPYFFLWMKTEVLPQQARPRGGSSSVSETETETTGTSVVNQPVARPVPPANLGEWAISPCRPLSLSPGWDNRRGQCSIYPSLLLKYLPDLPFEQAKPTRWPLFRLKTCSKSKWTS